MLPGQQVANGTHRVNSSVLSVSDPYLLSLRLYSSQRTLMYIISSFPQSDLFSKHPNIQYNSNRTKYPVSKTIGLTVCPRLQLELEHRTST